MQFDARTSEDQRSRAHQWRQSLAWDLDAAATVQTATRDRTNLIDRWSVQMSGQYAASYRTDEQLEVVLFETASWTINGRNGQVLWTAPSLQSALEKAANIAASGAVVVALCRLPGDNIIVFEAQAERLRKLDRAVPGN